MCIDGRTASIELGQSATLGLFDGGSECNSSSLATYVAKLVSSTKVLFLVLPNTHVTGLAKISVIII